MSRPLRVAIAGAGIAGLASAVFLARAGSLRLRPRLLCAPHLGVHQFEQLLWTQ